MPSCARRIHPGPRSRAAAALLVLGSLAPYTVRAQEAPPRAAPAVQAAPPAAPRPRETVFSLTVKGGWLMIPIGLCSIFVLTVAIERAISLRRSRVGASAILERIFDDLPPRGRITRDDVAAAIALCDADDSVLGRVLRSGVEKMHRDEVHVQEFLREAAAKELHVLKRKLRPFSISASLAPLLGLLGTIFGMITCFENATAVETAARADSLARGIYEALVTTAAGLCVAIPAMALYYYFYGRVDRIADLVEETATELLDHYYGAATVARAGKAPGGTPPHHPLRDGEGAPVHAAAASEGAAAAGP